MNDILNKKSGLLGITGKYIDRRDIRKAAEGGDKRAQLAIEIESYRGKKYIGAYMAALGQADALVFTAGVGENEPPDTGEDDRRAREARNRRRRGKERLLAHEKRGNGHHRGRVARERCS